VNMLDATPNFCELVKVTGWLNEAAAANIESAVIRLGMSMVKGWLKLIALWNSPLHCCNPWVLEKLMGLFTGVWRTRPLMDVTLSRSQFRGESKEVSANI